MFSEFLLTQLYVYNIWNIHPLAQTVEHGISNAKVMGSIPRESKEWPNVYLKCNASHFR